jgi:hypothetical protein
VTGAAGPGAPGQTPVPGVAEIEAAFRGKAEAEAAAACEQLTGGRFSCNGDPSAPVLLLKGVAGPVDIEEKLALAGDDGRAATASLERLGLPEGWAGAITRPEPAAAADPAALARLVEACDPVFVVALDREAAEDAAAAVGLERLPFGRPASLRGRVWLAVDGLEASLTDPARKRRVWAQLKTLADR